ncbi:TetR/AcrR family transcriptional regulator [Sphingobacterium sp. Mn56C]|uniref:TetR/AcrR family transcriptional regulator n=1 Tax=Sphingobacterium sp. Mn56C TaxID=3395261 RepID=UPI003BE1C26E
MFKFAHTLFDMELNTKQIEILKIAQDLFGSYGYEATSVREIAQAAGINVAMINYYFGSKDNLMEIIVKRAASSYMMDASIFDKEQDPILRLELMIEHYVQTKINNSHVYQIIASEANLKKRIINSDAFKELRSHNINLIKEVISYGCEKGVFKYYDPILIHATMIGTFMNFKINKVVFNELYPAATEKMYEEFINDKLINHLKFTLKAILTYEK